MKTEDDELWDVLESFDWDRVHFVMTQLDWYWRGSEVPPTVSELRTEARRLLKLCIEGSKQSNNCFSITTGGLEAHADCDGDVTNLSLKFVLCESNNYY
jgi:hypothetical protein